VETLIWKLIDNGVVN